MPKRTDPSLPDTPARIEGLCNEYLREVVRALETPETIDASVRGRRTIIVDPNVNQVNDGGLLKLQGKDKTLPGVLDQFDEKGNKRENATFTLHMPARANEEMDQFTRKDAPLLERLVATAIYFEAGSNLMLNHAHPSVKNITLHSDHIRGFVTSFLRDRFNFLQDPPNELKGSGTTVAAIGALMDMDKQYFAKLGELYAHAKDRIAELEKNPLSAAANKSSLEIYKKFNKAFDEYCKTGEMSTLQEVVSSLKNIDKSRLKGFGVDQTSKFIDSVSTTVVKHADAVSVADQRLKNLKEIEHAQPIVMTKRH